MRTLLYCVVSQDDSALRTDENPYADRLAALYRLGEDAR